MIKQEEFVRERLESQQEEEREFVEQGSNSNTINSSMKTGLSHDAPSNGNEHVAHREV